MGWWKKCGIQRKQGDLWREEEGRVREKEKEREGKEGKKGKIKALIEARQMGEMEEKPL